jgi:hypothetical protein
LPVPAGRRRAALVTIIATALIVAVLPAAVAAREPEGLNRFANAIGEVESGGRYDARNATSGAYGKYQILPSNWPAWAKLYLGDARAKPTPRNQERVARAKFIALYNWLDSWPAVAHWWLTGSGERNPSKWSPFSTKYVKKVIKLMATVSDKAPNLGDPPAATTTTTVAYQDTNSAIAWRGIWSKASYRSYAGGTVRYSTTAGASASLAFSGRAVSWNGPVGPTRGRARIYVDGRLVRTVDLGASGFTARRTIFSTSWSTSGAHTIRIEVLGTAGRPMVAIDELRVTR